MSNRNFSGRSREELEAGLPPPPPPVTSIRDPVSFRGNGNGNGNACHDGFGSNPGATRSIQRQAQLLLSSPSPFAPPSQHLPVKRNHLHQGGGTSTSSPNHDHDINGDSEDYIIAMAMAAQASTLSKTPSKHKVNYAGINAPTAGYNPSSSSIIAPVPVPAPAPVKSNDAAHKVTRAGAGAGGALVHSSIPPDIGIGNSNGIGNIHDIGIGNIHDIGNGNSNDIGAHSAGQTQGHHPHESPTKTDQLPRRILTFEPSPSGTSHPPSLSVTSPPVSTPINQGNPINTYALASTTPLKMAPLDGRHRSDAHAHQHMLHSQPPQQHPVVSLSGGPLTAATATAATGVQHSYSPQGQEHGHGQGYSHGYGHGNMYGHGHGNGHPPSQGPGHHNHTYPEYPHPQQPYSGQYGHLQQNPHPIHQSYPTQAPTANNNNHGSEYRPSPGPGSVPHHSYAPTIPYRDDYAQFSHPGHANSGGKDDAMPDFQPSPPPFDRIHMPFMELNSASHSETKHFEDLMVSPALNLSFSASGSAHRDRRTERRAPYDLHDQPAFNEHHDSPINIHRAPRNAPATKYCTPIVTGGNDRTRVTANTHSTSHSRQMEQNYRPSPPQGGTNDEDDYLRHYHRTFPTMRGGQPSPTRYDGSHPPSHPPHCPGSGQGVSPMYATPVFPRGGGPSDQGHHPGAGHSVAGHGHHLNQGSHNKYIQPNPNAPPPHISTASHNHGQHGHGHQMGGGYYDPNNQQHRGQHSYPPHHHHPSYPPRQDGHYPPPPPPPPSYNMGGSPYGAPPPPHPPPYTGYPPRYSQPHGNPHYPKSQNYNTTEKKRKRTETKRKAPKPARRKKMYSDFVGVTYNKTHAKFQACITHYRKQHYLGRFKLASDAAKAYDQSARILKGAGWKINFDSIAHYQSAREKEFKIVEEKKMGTGMDPETLRKSYSVSFPTDEAMRVKLGMCIAPSRTVAKTLPVSTTVPANVQIPRPIQSPAKTASTQHVSGNQYPTHPQQGQYQGPPSVIQHQHQQYGPPVPTAHPLQHQASVSATLSNINAGASGMPPLPGTIQQSQSQATSAVTPSPNVNQNNIAKNSGILMNEPLMSPGFASGSSPSALSILGGTPFSVPGSMMKSTSKSGMKGQTDSMSSQRDLDAISSNIFQSPREKMPSTIIANVSAIKPGIMNYSPSGIKTLSENDEELEKGKGDLTAASALLMMNNN